MFPSLTAERTFWNDDSTKLVWLAHKKAYEFASELCDKKNVIDLGCGQGWGSSLLAQVAKKVLAIDKDKFSIAFAQKHFSNKNLTFQERNLENLNLGSRKYDMAVCLQVIEHFDNPERLLQTIKKIVKKRGLLIISTPNKSFEHIPSPYHVKEYLTEEFKKILLTNFKSAKLFGIYEGKRINKLMNNRRQKNKYLLRLDVFRLTQFLPKSLLSIIFVVGTKIVGFLVKKSAREAFEQIGTKDYILRRKISDKALDIIAVCQ